MQVMPAHILKKEKQNPQLPLNLSLSFSTTSAGGWSGQISTLELSIIFTSIKVSKEAILMSWIN